MALFDTVSDHDDDADLEASIRGLLNGAPADDPEPDAAEPGPERDTAPASDPAEPVKAASDHPTDPRRHADGTWKANTEAAPAKDAAAEKPVSPSVDDQTKASAPASTPSDAPPAGWTADAKPEWSKLSPAVKAAVLKREQEIADGGRQWSEQRRQYERVLAPLAQETARLGIPVEQGLNSLLAAHHLLQRDPANAIKRIARDYGVDLATLTGQQSADITREGQQPDINALVERIVQERLGPIQDRFAYDDRQRQESTSNIVYQFASSPGHEHFDAVQNEIMALIPAIKGSNPSWSHEKILQEAYDRAVYANPTTRQSLFAARDAAAEEARRKTATEHAHKARRAAVSVTGSPSGAAVAQVPDDLETVIRQAFAGSLQ